MGEGFFFPTRHFISAVSLVKFGGNGYPHGRAVWEGMVFLPEQNCLRGSSAPPWRCLCRGYVLPLNVTNRICQQPQSQSAACARSHHPPAPGVASRLRQKLPPPASGVTTRLRLYHFTSLDVERAMVMTSIIILRTATAVRPL